MTQSKEKLYHVNGETGCYLAVFLLHMHGDVPPLANTAALKQNWSTAESYFSIKTLDELNIIVSLDGRKTRNSELFKQVHEKMKEAGLNQSVEKIKKRWKTLKMPYYKAKAHNSKSGFDPSDFLFYKEMDQKMGGRPPANVADHGVDVGFEDESCDGVTSLNAPSDDVEASMSSKFTSRGLAN